MRQILLALAFLGLTATAVFGDAKIPIKLRVPNQHPGYCGWASLETMCRHQEVKAGYGLLEKRKLDADWVRLDGTISAKNFADDDVVAWKLKSLGIKYRMNHTFSNTKEGIDLIKLTVKEGRAAMVGVWHDPLYHGHHAITVIDMDDENFSYIDSNDPKAEYEGSMRWLWQEWDGFVVTIEK